MAVLDERDLTVDHSWRSGSLVSHPGDTVLAEDGDADSGLRVSTTQSTEQYRWNVTFDPATGNSLTFRFATVVNYDDIPETGDVLVDATFGAGFTEGLFGASERDMATAHLMMRGTSD